MHDNSGSREGGTPEQNKMRRRRSRKLSGVAAQAIGELAFSMYVAASSEGDFREHLRSALLAWRARYIP